MGRAPWLRHLEHGGFPAIFAVRGEKERTELFNDWVQTTAFRDLAQFKAARFTGEEVVQALRALATVDEPTVAAVAAKLRKEGRRIKRLFSFLEQLFALHRIDPHPLSTGKPLYFLCDVGLAHFLGASFERRIETWFLHEQLALRAYRGEIGSELRFFRNSKGNRVHFVLELRDQPKKAFALKLLFTEKYTAREAEILHSLGKRFEREGIQLEKSFLAPFEFHLKKEGLRAFLWESGV